MKTHTHNTYKFDELSEDSQKNAVSKNWDWNVDGSFWYEQSIEDIKTIGAILGIEIENVFFSGFSSQGDGAQFVGSYWYEKQSLSKIKAYAPLDNELHAIAANLQELQKQNFYRLSARVEHSGHYYHKYCTRIDVENENSLDDYGTYEASEEIEDVLSEYLRDFMGWIYELLHKQFEYLTSEDAIKESLIANECEFNLDGTSHR